MNIKILSITLLSSTILLSCKKSNTESESSFDNNEMTEVAIDSTESDVEQLTEAEDWNVALDSYEEYVDSYIKLLKKSKAGDTSALSEYPEMMKNAQDLSEKMENANEELTSEQMSRFLKIQTKMSNAALELSK